MRCFAIAKWSLPACTGLSSGLQMGQQQDSSKDHLQLETLRVQLVEMGLALV